MPTKKKRVGFIPRSSVLDLINKLSYENNLSNSKIINILVEEALFKRGMFNIKTGMIVNNINNNNLKNIDKIKKESLKSELTHAFNNNLLHNDIPDINEGAEDSFDKEIYKKFLMFLQFQDRMKKRDL